ncbi:MAG: dipeptidase [Pseudomonadota bacterium]
MTQDPRDPPIFDGHNDVLSRLWRAGTHTSFLTGRDGAIDVEKARAGGFAGGFFAIFVPSPRQAHVPEPPTPGSAMPAVLAQARICLALERDGALRLCRTAEDVRTTISTGPLAAVLHLEGAEAIGPDLDALHVLYAAGLRSIGPVWSRPNIFGHGVPFKCPADPDIGPGLTDAGIALVREAEALGMVIDLSHLNAAGVDDVARVTEGPLIATHSNAHAICPHSRNLTDRQLSLIAERDGMVGLNFASGFLRPDGRMTSEVSLEIVLRHLDHLIGVLGEDRVGLGSDYDGAIVPADLKTAADLPVLRALMRDHGYTPALIAKLTHENWIAALSRAWRTPPV